MKKVLAMSQLCAEILRAHKKKSHSSSTKSFKENDEDIASATNWSNVINKYLKKYLVKNVIILATLSMRWTFLAA
ncbi:4700_t:CDS:1, partial [Paraglomus brasilianum]